MDGLDPAGGLVLLKGAVYVAEGERGEEEEEEEETIVGEAVSCMRKPYEGGRGVGWAGISYVGDGAGTGVVVDVGMFAFAAACALALSQQVC